MLAKRKKAYKIRDVWDEMELDGVAPNFETCYVSLFSCTKAKRLGDTLFYFNEMKRFGIQPDSDSYTGVIAACGRTGQLYTALEHLKQMQAAGHEPTKNTYLAMLNALSSAGQIDKALTMFQQMKAKGFEPDEFTYAALLNAYRHASPAYIPEDADTKILALLEEAFQVPPQQFSRPNDEPTPSDFVALNAAMNSLQHLGYHEKVLELWEKVKQLHEFPDEHSYAFVISSYLKDAVGYFRQPTVGAQRRLVWLRTIGKEQADMEAAAAATGSDLDEVDELKLAGDDEDMSAEEEDEAAGQSLFGSPVAQARHAIFKENCNVASWHKAVEIWRDLARQSNQSPIATTTFEMIQVALHMNSIGEGGAIQVAHDIISHLKDHGHFLNVAHGSTLLKQACRREVGDLTVAHHLWEMMLSEQRVPIQLACHCYLTALEKRAPEMKDRIKQELRLALKPPLRQAGAWQPDSHPGPDEDTLAWSETQPTTASGKDVDAGLGSADAREPGLQSAAQPQDAKEATAPTGMEDGRPAGASTSQAAGSHL
ncbi:hypothetical protein WJX72_005221 [[Myrmecia] bisecta]|uniref:Pentatricopeptide repeat-containing protein n=1 Tax=[Myrmecia] bisecta TaxID=41462 RepID=A0AAW1QF94_9CHLO